MNVAVFIAREENTDDPRQELSHYGKWFKQHNVGMKGGRDDDSGRKFSYWWKEDSSENQAMSKGRKQVRGGDGKNGWVDVTHDPRRFVNFCSDGSLIICSEKFDSFAALKTAYKTVDVAGEKANVFLSQIIGLIIHEIASVRNTLDETSSKEGTCKIDQLCLFIHWGEVDPFRYEKVFANDVEKFKKSSLLSEALNNLAQNKHVESTKLHIAIDDIRAFAVSSRREPCFNVNGDMICPPETSEGIEQLASRFAFDLVKDLLTKYVVECEKQNHSEKFLLDSADDSAILRRYLKHMRDVGISKAFPSKDAKWMKDVLAIELKSYIDDDKCLEIDHKDNIAALFTLLIREGVSHG